LEGGHTLNLPNFEFRFIQMPMSPRNEDKWLENRVDFAFASRGRTPVEE
jgi:hypothetical protein